MPRKHTDPRLDNRRLTSDQARQLRVERLRGDSSRVLGQRYGISATAAFYVCEGKIAGGKPRTVYAEPEAQPDFADTDVQT